MKTRYPQVVVKLTERDGNAFGVVGKVQRALEKEGLPESKIKEYLDDAMSGDYNHLLQVTQEWITVE